MVRPATAASPALPAIPAYEKAVQLLALRPHFRRELEQKLASRAYAPAEIEAALDRLTAAGYLDDRRAAAGFIAARLARGPEGRLRLAAELARRGVAADVASAALSAALPDDDLEAARAAAERWSRRGGKDPAALARHLARKGFSRRAIVRLLREEGSALESDGADD